MLLLWVAGGEYDLPQPYRMCILPALAQSTLAADYEYVTHGRVFRYEHVRGQRANTRVEVAASFGGLLMRLVGEQR